MQYSDRELACASCGQSFVFTGGEQAYYAQNGLQEPRRCKACRAQRRAQGGDGGNGDRARGGPGRGHGGGGGDYRGPRRGPGFRPASPDDPNGYRAPAFTSPVRAEHVIDYAGLPRDEGGEEETDGQAAMLGLRSTAGFDREVDRFGLRT